MCGTHILSLQISGVSRVYTTVSVTGGGSVPRRLAPDLEVSSNTETCCSSFGVWMSCASLENLS